MTEAMEMAEQFGDEYLAVIQSFDDARRIAKQTLAADETQQVIDNLAEALMHRARRYHKCKRVDRVVPVMGSIYCGCPICDPDD